MPKRRAFEQRVDLQLGLMLLVAGCFWMGIGAGPPASEPATGQIAGAHYEALSPDQFFKLPATQQAFTKDKLDMPLLEASIFEQTNVERSKHGLPAFKPSEDLQVAAREHSQEMLKLNYFAHESPVAAHRTPEERIRAAGFRDAHAMAENIAMLPTKQLGSGKYVVHNPGEADEYWTDAETGKRVGYYTYEQFAAAMLDQWMHSPPHRANILSRETAYLGVGGARGAFENQDSVLMTQDFASASGNAEGAGTAVAK